MELALSATRKAKLLRVMKRSGSLQKPTGLEPNFRGGEPEPEQAPRLARRRSQGSLAALSNVQRNIGNLDQVVEAIDRGASTGVIESALPAWDASTIELRNLQSRLGLDVIGSVTFGALSEGELNLRLLRRCQRI
jgi:hypothetical protein